MENSTNSPAKATGVLITYQDRRLQNLRKIIERMFECDRIDEVFVWSNRPDNLVWETVGDMPNVEVFGNGTNYFTLGRFLATATANNPLIATCDDDCLVHDWNPLFDRHDETGKITAYMGASHIKYGQQNWRHKLVDGSFAYEFLLGWGSVFQKSRTKVLERWFLSRGMDELVTRKADRVFTIMQQERHEFIEREPHHLPGAMDPDALYRQTKGDWGHWRTNKVASEACVRILNKEIQTKERMSGY